MDVPATPSGCEAPPSAPDGSSQSRIPNAVTKREIRTRKSLKKRLRTKYGDNCCWCFKPMLFGLPWGVRHLDAATIEHVIPKRHGGSDDESNLMLSHYRCNDARNREDISRAAQAGEARRAETTGSVHEHAVPQGCAQSVEA